MTPVKICGITTRAALDAAAAGGAAFAGFVFYPPSPRALTVERAAPLAAATPPGLRRVGLFVDPDDALLDAVRAGVGLDMIQLHGTETPARTAAVAARCGLPVIKALRVAAAADVAQARLYGDAADWLLFDAAPAGAALPGGTGRTFDWALLDGFSSRRPWMLSGGLNAANIGAALARLHPDAVDISSGAEDAPGQKNPEKIMEFLILVNGPARGTSP